MCLNELLQEFMFHCECRRFSPRTIENYRKQIQYLIDYVKQENGITKVEEVEPCHIRAFLMMKYNQGRKPAYINDLLKAHKVYFRYAKEEGYIAASPADKVKNMKLPKVVIRTFDKQEIKRMLRCYEGIDFVSIRNKTILLMLFDTGMRLSELTGLTEENIHDDFILVHGKGDKERVVPKSPVLSKWLMKYIRARNACFGREYFETLFVSRYKSPLCKSMVAKIVKDAGEYANVRSDIRISPHTIRHCFCQQQLCNGLDLYSLSRIMGHENITITQRYLEGIRDTEVLSNAKYTSTIMNL